MQSFVYEPLLWFVSIVWNEPADEIVHLLNQSFVRRKWLGALILPLDRGVINLL